MESNKYSSPHCAEDWEGVADWFAPVGSELSEEAKAICSACPLKYRCATKACDEGIPHGVFGGMDRDDRLAYWGTDEKGRTLRPTKFEEDIQRALKTAMHWHKSAVAA